MTLPKVVTQLAARAAASVPSGKRTQEDRLLAPGSTAGVPSSPGRDLVHDEIYGSVDKLYVERTVIPSRTWR